MACKCASNMHIPEGGICRGDEHAEYAGISQTAPRGPANRRWRPCRESCRRRGGGCLPMSDL